MNSNFFFYKIDSPVLLIFNLFNRFYTDFRLYRFYELTELNQQSIFNLTDRSNWSDLIFKSVVNITMIALTFGMTIAILSTTSELGFMTRYCLLTKILLVCESTSGWISWSAKTVKSADSGDTNDISVQLGKQIYGRSTLGFDFWSNDKSLGQARSYPS